MFTQKGNKGQVLAIVIAIMLFLTVIIPGLIYWTQNQTKWSVKQQRKSVAFNLAETGIDRGMWKLKSSTSTWDMASKGKITNGYNFDTTYTDISGGIYRIKFTSGPSSCEVTVTAEGKDSTLNEIRAIKAIFRNQVIPGAIISKDTITMGNAFSVHWGPIMSHGNIEITNAAAAQDYFPRKYSRQVVTCNQAGYARDTNGMNPPNTDNMEWWSDYDVPDLPLLDFDALRSSAAINVTVYQGTVPYVINTLNVFGCSKMKNYTGLKWWQVYDAGEGGWVDATTCKEPGNDHSGLPHVQNLFKHPFKLANRTWYWDDNGDKVFWVNDRDVAGYPYGYNAGWGVVGNFIVRGNLENNALDNLSYDFIDVSAAPGRNIPEEAYKEYTLIQRTGVDSYYDTSATNEYPGDDGYQKTRKTFRFGGETWTRGHNPPNASSTDIGIKGFLYVGKNLQIDNPMDIFGAAWIVGNTSEHDCSESFIIFYDDSLDLPALNVVLVRKLWQEIPPSSTTWP
ncbi:MAG: hypothetical protein KKH91_06225 [Elusimicrobia bacterium]|nr:hypothetical protein [Elusimicrobiota bacterium]